MNIPFAWPDWLPGWLPFVILVPVLLYVLVFLAVPFAVFGVKGRLDLLEARLDEIQGEIRLLSLRLPEPSRSDPYADRPAAARPPIPPAGTNERLPDGALPPPRSIRAIDDVGQRRWPPEPDDAGHGNDRAAPRRRPTERPDRSEPRLDWPR